jgi:hypothetical protein
MSSDRVIIDAIKVAKDLLWQNLPPTHNLTDAATVMRFRELVRSKVALASDDAEAVVLADHLLPRVAICAVPVQQPS